ncbi:hypothetical protein H8R18_07875 [Nanchangia anserum]|uniref:hypothetical protein n=1 Tax=Nanchangia anserum TaxID=2692125 RepID=UPI001883AEFA|nr:hypothetical protein [Nanchangia anserum]QOX81641.1 hypothetical protein H8R18_07875 [Nanchangia anserum]
MAVVAVIVFACGWGRLVHAPAPGISAVIIAVMALASLGVVRVTMDAAWGVYVAGFVVCAAFIGEMVRGRGRTSVLGSLATTVTGTVLAMTTIAWIALENYRVWLILAHPMGICLVVAGACLFLRGSVWMRVLTSIVLCTLGGLVAVGLVMVAGLGANDSILVASASVGTTEPMIAMLTVFGAFGMVSGLVVAGCHAFFAGRMAPTSLMGAAALGMIPWLTAAIPVYAFARIMGG